MARWLSTAEAAADAGVNPATVWRWTQAHKVVWRWRPLRDVRRTGHHGLEVEAESLEEFLELFRRGPGRPKRQGPPPTCAARGCGREVNTKKGGGGGKCSRHYQQERRRRLRRRRGRHEQKQ